MISANHDLNLRQLYIQQNAVSCLSEFHFAWESESAARSHEHGNTHLRNITDLESTRKSLVPLFFWNTPVHSDSSSSSASGTCEKLATPSLSPVSLQQSMNLSLNEHLSQGQR